MAYSYRNTHTFSKTTNWVDASYGYSIDFNDDGTRLAIGSVRADNSGNAPLGTSEENPSVEIFEYDGSTWNIIGAIHQDTLSNPEYDSNQLGISVSMNGDGSVVAVGSGNVDKGGSVYVFEETRPTTGTINSIYDDPSGNARWTLRETIDHADFSHGSGDHRRKTVEIDSLAKNMVVQEDDGIHVYSYDLSENNVKATVYGVDEEYTYSNGIYSVRMLPSEQSEYPVVESVEVYSINGSTITFLITIVKISGGNFIRDFSSNDYTLTQISVDFTHISYTFDLSYSDIPKSFYIYDLTSKFSNYFTISPKNIWNRRQSFFNFNSFSLNGIGNTIALGDNTDNSDTGQVIIYYSTDNWMTTDASFTIQPTISQGSKFGTSVGLDYSGTLLSVGISEYNASSGGAKVFYNTSIDPYNWTESDDISYSATTYESIVSRQMGKKTHIVNTDSIKKLILLSEYSNSNSNSALQILHTTDASGADFYIQPHDEDMVNSIKHDSEIYSVAVNSQGTFVAYGLISSNKVFLMEYTTPIEWRKPVIFDVLSDIPANRDFSGVDYTIAYGENIFPILNDLYDIEKTYVYWNTPYSTLNSKVNKNNPIQFQYTYYSTETRDVSFTLASSDEVRVYINSVDSGIQADISGISVDFSMDASTNYVFDFYCRKVSTAAFFSFAAHHGLTKVLFNTSKSTEGWKWRWAEKGFFVKNYIPLSGLYGGGYMSVSDVSTNYFVDGVDVGEYFPMYTEDAPLTKIPDIGLRFDISGVSHDFSEVFAGFTIEPSIVFDFSVVENLGKYENNINDKNDIPNDVSLSTIGTLDSTFKYVCTSETTINNKINVFEEGTRSNLSILFWMKTTGTGVNNLVHIDGNNGDYPSISRSITIDHSSYGLKITIQGESSDNVFTNNSIDGTDIEQIIMNDGKWHHVGLNLNVVSTRGSFMEVYVDGQFITYFMRADNAILSNRGIDGTANGSKFLQNSSQAQLALFKIFTGDFRPRLTAEQIELIYLDENPAINLNSKYNSYLPVVNGLTHLFIAENTYYDVSWTDVINGATADLSGLIHVGYNHMDVAGLDTYGANATFPYLYGDISSQVEIPITSMSSGNYTLVHVTRYHHDGGERGRIWQTKDAGVDWISGHYYDAANSTPNIGVNFENKTSGIEDANGVHLDERWIISIHDGTNYRCTYIDPEDQTIKTNTVLQTSTQHPTATIGINNGQSSELSDWACAFVAIFDRSLSDAEIDLVRDRLIHQYLQPSMTTTRTAKERRELQHTPIVQGLRGLFVVDDTQTYDSVWEDKSLTSDASLNLLSDGTTTGLIDVCYNDPSSPYTNNGSIVEFPYIKGDTYTSVRITDNWPIQRNEFTFVHLTRYAGEPFDEGKIWRSGDEPKFFSGFVQKVRGSYRYVGNGGGEVYNEPFGATQDWLLTIHKPNIVFSKDTYNDYRFEDNSFYLENIGGDIGINLSNAGNIYHENWACGFAAIYDRLLSDAECLALQSYLYSKFISPDLTYNALYERSKDYVPVYEGLVGLFVADAESVTATSWLNKAKYNDPDVSGTLTYDALSSSTNGSEMTFYYVSGSTNTMIDFANSWPGNNYTLFHVSRYTNANQTEIFNGVDDDGHAWVSGFNSSKRGYFSRDGTELNTTSRGDLEHWLLVIDQPKKCQIIDLSINETFINDTIDLSGLTQVGINKNKTGEWACSFAAYYSRELSNQEILDVSRKLYRTYFTLTETYEVSIVSNSIHFVDFFGVSGTPVLTPGSTYTFKNSNSLYRFHVGNSLTDNNLFAIDSTGTGKTKISSDYGYEYNSILNDETLTFTIPVDFSGTIGYYFRIINYDPFTPGNITATSTV